MTVSPRRVTGNTAGLAQVQNEGVSVWCLLIIGDNGPALQNTCDILREHGIEVDSCANADALTKVARKEYSLVVLYDSDSAGACQACSHLRRRGCDSCIVVVARSPREADQLRLFEAGADDVITSAISSRLLAERIKAHARRLGQGRQSGTMTVAERAGQKGGEANTNIAGSELTRIEGRLFACLCASAGALVTRDALYKAGWPSNQRVMPQTLYVHISTLRRKLAPSGWLLHAVDGRGYCLSSQAAPSPPVLGTGSTF